MPEHHCVKSYRWPPPGFGLTLFVGRLRIRWAGPNFRPLFSERSGRRPWYGVGRLKVRWDREGA